MRGWIGMGSGRRLFGREEWVIGFCVAGEENRLFGVAFRVEAVLFHPFDQGGRGSGSDEAVFPEIGKAGDPFELQFAGLEVFGLSFLGQEDFEGLFGLFPARREGLVAGGGEHGDGATEGELKGAGQAILEEISLPPSGGVAGQVGVGGMPGLAAIGLVAVAKDIDAEGEPGGIGGGGPGRRGEGEIEAEQAQAEETGGVAGAKGWSEEGHADLLPWYGTGWERGGCSRSQAEGWSGG